MSNDIASVILFFIQFMTIAIIGRALLSWFDPGMRTAIGRLLFQITEPLVGPIRQIMPSLGMIDISPIVALVLLQMIGRFVSSAL